MGGVDEKSPLLPIATDAPNTAKEVPSVVVVPDVAILVEIVGARNLLSSIITSTTPSLSYHCVAHYKSKHREVEEVEERLHCTRPVVSTNGHPLWSIKDSPLFVLHWNGDRDCSWMTTTDTTDHLVLSVWATKPVTRVRKKLQALPLPLPIHVNNARCLGQVQISNQQLWNLASANTEQRVELPLASPNNTTTATNSQKKQNPQGQQSPLLLAIRVRLASSADMAFVTAWKRATGDMANSRIPRTVLQGTGVLPNEPYPTIFNNYLHQPRPRPRPIATLVTELEGWQVSGARLSTAAASKLRVSMITQRKQRRGKIRVKPGPDPSDVNRTKYVTKDTLTHMAREPSRLWIPAGRMADCGSTSTTSSSTEATPISPTLGRLYLEVLSCHDLPNVDFGTAVMGNQTDAFVTIVYADSMAQTPIIDDELSPHWPPWTPRAFVFAIWHPAHVLYLAVFGYKRGVFHHVPIGRVELNPLQFIKLRLSGNNHATTEYTLEYDLVAASHSSVNLRRRQQQQQNGNTGNKTPRIRIRLRVEVDQPRTLLLTSIRQPIPQPVYLNCHKRETWHVAKYTACGECDTVDTFSMQVFLAYIDELLQGFLPRLLYATKDGVDAVVLWRRPGHSLLWFICGILVVEQPAKFLIPVVLCFAPAYILLVNLSVRNQSPSPWYRCPGSYWDYLSVLMIGRSINIPSCGPKKTTGSNRKGTVVKPREGWLGQSTLQQSWQRRMERDNDLSERKGRLEKEIESIEKEATVQTMEQQSIVRALEALELLGKIQGIVGRFMHMVRTIDYILRWEQSDRSFWITTILLGLGMIGIFIPWAWLLRWTGRLSVVILLGPQNKVLDMLYWKKHHDPDIDEAKLRQIFEERIFRARCKQEDVSKLKAFRQVIFGKFGTIVPDLSWTPHLDRPRPESQARLYDPVSKNVDQKARSDNESNGDPCVPGQQLYGAMIPRPYNQWLANMAEAKRNKGQVLVALAAHQQRLRQEKGNSSAVPISSTPQQEQCQYVDIETANGDTLEEGVEVTDVISNDLSILPWSSTNDALTNNEVSHHRKSPRASSHSISQESLRGDWGVEAVDLYEDEAVFVRNSWQFLSSKANMLNLSDSSSSSDEEHHREHADGKVTMEHDNSNSIFQPLLARHQWIQSQLTAISDDEDCSKEDFKDNGSPSASPVRSTQPVPNINNNCFQEVQDEVDCSTMPPSITRVKTFETESGADEGEIGFEATMFGEETPACFSASDGSAYDSQDRVEEHGIQGDIVRMFHAKYGESQSELGIEVMADDRASSNMAPMATESNDPRELSSSQ